MTDGGVSGSPLRRAWVEIDAGALVRNFRRVAGAVAPARVLPVVKADAYGHGVLAVAEALEPAGAPGFAVALVEEGIELRRAGFESSVLVLSPTPVGAEEALVEFDLAPAISGLDQLDRIEAMASAAGRHLPVHLKFDTGMTRLGLPAEAAREILQRVRTSRCLRLAGLMSHLAEAESPESPANRLQLERFAALVGLLGDEERSEVEVHLANSCGALFLPATRFDVVRVGLALYGAGPERSGLDLEPVMSLRAELVQVRDVAPGTRAGYGGRWVAPGPARVGVVPLGYADGYPWRAESEVEVLVRGRRARLAGAVSMDLILIDLTATGGEVGEVVTLLGEDGGERITASELARRSGTLVYEVLCHFGLRLPRFAGRLRGSERRGDAPREAGVG
ncbi:MAG TPA: alanine racemase [Thermoanaerobaculia bacterium]|nr:alanine racemase [Thermoanaerobaculia bacterium]